MDESTDTLGRWMAHYIAELMDGAADCPPEERGSAQRTCFEAILNLWSHRADFPKNLRPFEELEPVVRTIRSLDPENETPRYFRGIGTELDDKDENSEAQALLRFAMDLDSSARILICYFLSEVAHSAIDESKEWVKLAQEADAELGIAEILIQFVSERSHDSTDTDATERERRFLHRVLRDRIDRLEGFVKTATLVADNLKMRLKTLPPV